MQKQNFSLNYLTDKNKQKSLNIFCKSLIGKWFIYDIGELYAYK